MKVETKPEVVGTIRTASAGGGKNPVLWAMPLLFLVLCLFFWKSLSPNQVAFSNDGPYGLQMAKCNSMPGIITGVWQDLGWLGNEGVSPSPDVTCALLAIFPQRLFCNVFAPAALLIAGIGASFCLRQFKLAPLACLLGGLAALLNSDFLSTACWGVAAQTITFGMGYLAVGLLAGTSDRRPWVRVILAGLAVGVGVMEGFDIGAIFSLCVAAFALFHALFLQEGSTAKKFGAGIARIAIVAVFAGIIAVHTLSLLVGTQIKGVAGVAQDEQTKKERWGFVTQFSFPKTETLQILVPGIFGYRNVWHMYDNDQPKEDQYWGLIGAEPAQGMWRLTGTGFYAGVLVVVVALWGVTQSFRNRGCSPYTQVQRRAIWFWTGVSVVALLLAYGKFAPFFQFFYALPYASTIRSPVKFVHVFSWALVILFGYGVHGLTMAYMRNPVARARGWVAQFKKWRSGASPFERRWIIALLSTIGAGLLGWLIYASKDSALVSYLQTVGISADVAPGVAKFSVRSVGWFILFLVLTAGLMVLIFSGQFAGPRAKWGGILLGGLLVVDLGRAAIPWIVYYDVNYKFADDPIIDILADKPYEHRVAFFPAEIRTQQQALLHNAYGSHWNQHLFPYHNIQCFDIAQEPRVAVDKDKFMHAIPPNLIMYELLNVRYLLGPGGDYLQQILQQIGPAGKLFRVVKSFNLVPKPNRPNPTAEPVDWISQEDPNGQLAVLEFTAALPRAKLYSNWQVVTNDDDTLHDMASQSFDPHQTAYVADPIAGPATGAVNPPDDAVKITSYESKRIELKSDARNPTVLLLCERYHPKWRVWVDGNPASVLRCNFIERGVYLPAGKHTIVFRFMPSMTTFYVSLAAVFLGLILCGWLAIEGMDKGGDGSRAAAEPGKERAPRG
jgi:hypothetical protein